MSKKVNITTKVFEDYAIVTYRSGLYFEIDVTVSFSDNTITVQAQDSDYDEPVDIGQRTFDELGR